MPDAVLLASGGLDSTTMAYWLFDQGVSVLPLFFDYGQHCVEKEWETLARVLGDKAMPPERVSLREVFRGSSSRMVIEPDLWAEEVRDSELYIPYRTMLFFTAAAAKAQTLRVTDVYAAFINSSHAKELDCTAEYLNGLDALSENVGAVRFRLPFRQHSKKQVAQLAIELGVPVGQTFSCQVFSDTPCGACPNCVERLGALRELELVS